MRNFKVLQLLLGLWCVGVFASAVVAQPTDQRNILILSAEQDHVPPIQLADRGFRNSLAEAQDLNVQYFRESLDGTRIDGRTYEKEFVDLLRQKYRNVKIDLIVAYGRTALAFLMRNEVQLFTDLPKVFVASDQRELVGIDLGTHAVGATGKIEIGPTMELLLAQNPKAKKVGVIFGTTAVDLGFRERTAAEFEMYTKRVEIVYLEPSSIDGLREQIAALPPGSAILLVTFMGDRQGNVFTTPQTVSLLAPTAQHPIYTLSDASIGSGTLGGMMLSYEAIGKYTGELGKQILAGKRPIELSGRIVPAVPIFDWRELQKWDIDENRLPYGSVVAFRTPTLWEQYRVYIAVVAAIMLIQAVLIAALLFAQARKRKAEAERNRYQELAASEHKRLEEIVGNVPGAVWESEIDPETGHRKLTFISDYIETMLGYTVEEWLENDRLGFPIMHEDDRERVADEINSVVDSGEPKAIEFRWYAKDRSIRWVELTIVAICDAEGNVTGFRGVNIDITKRKEAEETVRESETRFRDLADCSPMLVWVSDTEMNITFANRTLLEFTGRSFEELAGEGWLECVHNDDVQPCVETYSAAYENYQPFAFDYRFRRADGEFRWFHDRGEPRFASDGEFLGYVGSAVDITDIKAASEAIKESGELFKNIADSAPILIWMSDTEMQCNFFNERCSEFTGRPLEELMGEGWLESVHESDLQPMIQVYSSAYETQSPFLLEYRLRRHDGVYRWIYAVGEPRFDQKGEFLGYIGTGIDMTERREAEQSLQTALTEISGLKAALQEENIYLKEMIKLEHDFAEIIGNSDELKYVLFKIEQVAPTDATVLIAGETGTGKELVARAVHNMSSRKQRPLIKVNCAALSASLIESELFGHERGAFTGATGRKIGRFELADGGTIFLDEIGELPLELQPKLLRLIQEGEFERLGSSRTVKADVRIIAATNRDLQKEVKKGTFREDLLYRLNVFPITVPPLRDRTADIPLLVEHFTAVFSKKMGKTITSISPAVMRSLTEYTWPGNVRELANVIERAVIGASDEILRVHEQFEIKVSSAASPGPAASIESLESSERTHIIKALVATKWRIEGSSGAARVLGINPSTLRSRMQKLGISKAASQTVH